MASPKDWQATIKLSPVDDIHAAAPETLVPKQSIEMTTTVWMPEKVNWFPLFPEWDMPGATVVSMFMLSPSIERQQGTFTQRGATQNYLVTPLNEGSLTLSPLSIVLYPDQPSSPHLDIAPVTLEVSMPDGAGDIAHFLPATAVKLTQTFYLLTADKQEQEIAANQLKSLTLKQGQLLERRILIEAKGIQGKLIPELQPDATVSQHDAEATDILNYDEFIGGTRTERWYYAPQDASSVTLNAVNLRWYDTRQQRFETAKLDGVTLKSERAASVKSGIQLSIWERLTLLPAKTWWLLLAGIVMVAVLIGCRRTFARFLRCAGHVLHRNILASSRMQLAGLCLRLALAGAKNPDSLRHYQRWLAQSGAGPVWQSAVLTRWSAANYGATTVAPPGRFTLIRALMAQRHKNKKQWHCPLLAVYGLPALEEHLAHCPEGREEKSIK
ncbi:hypothetical protein ACG8U7_002101 [Klebsiella aerogenes]